MPDTWYRDYFLYVLYCWGYVSVINTNKFGVIPQACSLRGYDVFYRPNIAMITNPLLNGMRELHIDTQCTLFKLQPDYGGIMDIVDYYAEMMALCAETAQLNLINSKLSYVFTAGDKGAAESFKKMFDGIMSGNPAVIIDKNLLKSDGSMPWQLFSQNVGQNYIVGDILTDMRTWENKFDTDVGIPNANTDKKERLISNEVEANNTETFSKCSLWLDELKKTCEKTRDMFGINITVDWRDPPQSKLNPNPENKNVSRETIEGDKK